MYCIGFGFPDTDLPIRFLLTDSQGLRPTDFFLIDVDERVIERVRALLPAHFNLRLDLFGPDWTTRLQDHLFSIQPVERGYDSDAATTAKLRSWCLDHLRAEEDLQCVESPPGVFLISEVSERGVTIADRQIGVPYLLTWRALGRVIAQTSKIGVLPIARPRPDYNAMSVEYLLAPWYSRACGRVAASLLTKAEAIFLVDNANIGGLTQAFARSSP